MASRTNRGKIVYLLSLIVFVFLILAYISYVQLNKAEEIRKTDELVEKIDIACMDMFRTDVGFFNYEISNSVYYKNNNSIYLTEHDSLVRMVDSLISSIKQEDIFSIGKPLAPLQKMVMSYDSVFKRIVVKINERGFKDFGLEGELRSYAHHLEEDNLVAPTELLTLRRHEKDYLLRNEAEYVRKFDVLIDKTKTKYSSNKQTSDLLTSYDFSFEKLVQVTNDLGFHSRDGMKTKLDKLSASMLAQLDKISAQAEKSTENAHERGMNIFLISIAVGTIFCFILVAGIARKV